MDNANFEIDRKGFTQVSNTLICDETRLSWRAKGIYSYLNSRPPVWRFFMSEIAKHATEPIGAVKTAIKELETFGYLTRTRKPNEKGQISYTYRLHHAPVGNPTVLGKPEKGEVKQENHTPTNPIYGATHHMGSPSYGQGGGYNNTDNSNTDKSNTKKKTTPEEPSDKGQAFADWFATLLEETESSLKPAQADKLAWGKEFDKIIRLEAIKEDQLKHICRWARNDPFWRTNFYSPAKLRKKSRDGVKFLTIFIDRAPPMPVERVWDDTLFSLPENGGAF
jgi:hypothetical protein